MATLCPILYVTPWERIIFVRGTRNLGRITDDRINPALKASATQSAMRWRSPRNAFAIVVWAGEERKSLVYNYEAQGVSELAALLLEAYDEKLVGLRQLPHLWWFDLQPHEALTLHLLQRKEFHLGDAAHQLLPFGVHHQVGAVGVAGVAGMGLVAQVPEAFNPDYQMLDDDNDAALNDQMAHYCAEPFCWAPASATVQCPHCQQRFCSSRSCYELHAPCPHAPTSRNEWLRNE